MNKNYDNKKKNKFDEFLDNESEEMKFVDETNKIQKGDENKDIRFNPNNNRKEVDVATSENQLR